MTLSAGTRLGPYELLGPLGAGGMGEVYRARDTRLQREVAVKVLPAELASDTLRLKRFETEARLASALNHPNIVTIHEVGQSDSTSFIVMELVAGKTLRELLYVGPLPLRKLLSIAAQVADGLAKAHASGIVHRDLKPENVMVTGDGLVKILDFGLAKLTHPDSDGGQAEKARTIPGGTEPGVVMGTVGYMSPEQAAGQRVDFRSDQFSFGSILYEMATGKRAFERTTRPEILAAIIRDEPEPISALNSQAPSQLRWIVERCLAKEPRDRYAATEDLARDLATLREHVSELSGEARVPLEARRRRARWGGIGMAAVLLVALAGTYLLGRRVERSQTSSPRFRQLTFRGAGISTARFAPDGQTVVYAAQSEGKPPELFTERLDSPETRPLGLSESGDPLHLLLGSDGAACSRPGWPCASVRPTGTFRSTRVSFAESSPRRRWSAARRGSFSRTCTLRTGARTASRSPSFAISEAKTGSNFQREECSTKTTCSRIPTVFRSRRRMIGWHSSFMFILYVSDPEAGSAISVSEPWRLRGLARRMRSGSTPSRAGATSFSPWSRVARREA